LILLFEGDRLVDNTPPGCAEVIKTDGKLFTLLKLATFLFSHFGSSYRLSIRGSDYAITPWGTWMYLWKNNIKIARISGVSWSDLRVKSFGVKGVKFLEREQEGKLELFAVVSENREMGKIEMPYSLLKSKVRVELEEDGDSEFIAIVITAVLHQSISLP
jgi:hypothetical protein